ncbi:MAG: transposase [Desulforhopalus sp.]|jgi:transposase
MSNKIHAAVFEDEFRICPNCGYNDGFHTMLKRDKDKDLVRLLFICPSCHETFDLEQVA